MSLSSSSSSSSSSSLPVEILFQIIQLLRKKRRGGAPIPLRDYGLVPYALVSSTWAAVVLPIIWEDLVIQWDNDTKETARLLDVLWETKSPIIETSSTTVEQSTIGGSDSCVSRVNFNYISYVKNLHLRVCHPSKKYDPNPTTLSTIRCLQLLYPAQLHSLYIILNKDWTCTLSRDDMHHMLDTIIPATTQISRLYIYRYPHGAVMLRLSPTLREIRVEDICLSSDGDFLSVITHPIIHSITLPSLLSVKINLTAADLACGVRAWGSQLRQLKLKVTDPEHSDEAVHAIADNCPKLESLDYQLLQAPPSANHAMCALIDKCPCLNYLTLRGSKIVSNSFIAYCTSKAYRLKELYIIGDVGFIGKEVGNVPGWQSRRYGSEYFGYTRDLCQ